MIDFSIIGATQGVVNIERVNRKQDQNIRRVVREFSLYTRDLTRFFCPVGSGFMQRQVKTELLDDGYAFETGWNAEDFFNANRSFYPPFVEFGTRKMPARPSLGRAMEIAGPEFKDAIASAVATAAL
jgi:HK97 gp10 family phage protein